MKNNFLIPVLGAVCMLACKTQTHVVEAPVMEESQLDTLVVTASPIDPQATPDYTLPLYRASATRFHDLLHTRLELSFDWEKQHVLGRASLVLTPYFYPSDSLVLDAKVFDFHSIKMNGEDLDYTYDQSRLVIDLERTFTRSDTFTVDIDYTAKPNEGPSGGSLAITSDKGLFFIDPLDEDAEKPSQIWTQGETENSSRWFPTIDKPNERTTQEIIMTVDNKYKTLSNGLLVSSTVNADGTRTDHWVQDQPHAPYLFMVGVGEYAVVEDKWRDIPLMYYVEPEYRDHAEAIFQHTPEMMEFFSDALGYPYPWDKYAQIVCRDYVSGAMENTGAVVFGEFVQKTAREILDAPNDDIVAHELFHHWFGDLVTCESWSHLTLNEGFATYSEYLWREYKYGPEDAERKRLEDLNGYLMSSSQSGHHDLIDFQYANKENMFDAHSYNKGGLIVHMLREYVGDEAFFEALNLYLRRNAYSDVEAHELRLAFEDVTGEDLNWFFDQWFFDKGHPVLEVDYAIDIENKTVEITASQVQDAESFPPIFRLPVRIILYYPSGQRQVLEKVIDERTETFLIPVERPEMPVVAVLDGTHDLLAVIKEDRTDEDYFKLFMLSDEYEDKYLALKALKKNPEFSAVFAEALSDPSAEIRGLGIAAVNADTYRQKLMDIALYDSDSGNRASALYKLKDPGLAKKLIVRDSSFTVIATALDIIKKEDPGEALLQAERLRKGYYRPLVTDMAEIYAGTGDVTYLSFFRENINKVNLYSFFNFMKQYEKLARKADPEDIVKTGEVLAGVAEGTANYFKAYASIQTIENLMQALKSRQKSGADNSAVTDAMDKLKGFIQEVVSNTTDQRLKTAFRQYQVP